MTAANPHKKSSLHLLLGLFACVVTGSVLAAPPTLTVSGTSLVASGANVRLKGVNIMGYEYSSTGDHVAVSVAPAIDTWKAKILRIPISQDYWMGYLGANAATYRAAIDSVVNTASGKGSYVIVDLHWSDMGQWGQNHGQHMMPDDNTTTAWNDIANHYKNNPAVLFGAYNEPHDISWSVWLYGGNVTEGSRTYHTPGIQGIINTIRNTGANNVINVGGLGWSNDLTGVVKTTASGGYRPSGSNIMYDVHLYTWSGTFTDFDNRVTVAKNAGLCVHIGEFGSAPGDDAWEQQMISWIDSNNYNATAWCFYAGNVSFDLLVDWTSMSPTSWGGVYVKNWLAQSSSGGGQPIPNSTYRIMNRNSGKALDAYNNATANGTQIDQYTYNGGNNQRWVVTSLSGAQYKIIGVQSGRALDVYGNATANGTKIELWDYNAGNGQKWTFTLTDSGNYRLTPANATGSCLDVSGASTADGALVQLWTYGGGYNQQWWFYAP